MIGRNALILLGFLLSSTANADPVKIAVAANFAKVAEALADNFEADGHGRIAIVIGSTGALYLQITQGAPFEAFLAADRERPERLEVEGLTIPGSRFTYALGHLALYTRRGAMPDADTLASAHFQRLAIANPTTAPYGAAAIEAISALGLMDHLSTKLVRGKSVAQAFQFAWSGSAEYALVSEAQAQDSAEGNFWPLPKNLYQPIAQDAVLTINASPKAAEFLNFMKSPAAQALIARAGYSIAPH